MSVVQCPDGHICVVEHDADHYYCHECNHRPQGDDPVFEKREAYPAKPTWADPTMAPKTAGDIRARLNIHTDIVPFECCRHDRIDLGNHIADMIENAAPTVREFTLADLARAVDPSRDLFQSVSERLWILHNAQPLWGVSQAHHVYLNPDYVHLESCGPSGEVSDDEIMYHGLTAASVGCVEKQTVELLLGVDDLIEYIPDWKERRAAGRVRMANTLVTARAWSDAYDKDIYRAYNVPETTYYDYCREWAEIADVPRDPSQSLWGTGGLGEGEWKPTLVGGDKADA